MHTHSHATAHSFATGTLARRAAWMAVSASGFLILLKAYGWFTTDSLSIFSSMVDSSMDFLISAFNLFAIAYALKPADDDHRFGHTAIEDIAGLAQAGFIVGSALFILLEAAGRFITPEPVVHTQNAMYIMYISIAVTTLLVVFQKYTVRKSGSIVVEADMWHYLSDILTNLAIISALLLHQHFGWLWADPVLAVLIAAVIMHSAIRIGVRAFHNLMDREMPDDEKARIKDIVAQEKNVRGFHQLKTRQSGRKKFIQMHIELPETLTFPQAHEITERLEAALEHAFGEAEIIIHQDPVKELW